MKISPFEFRYPYSQLVLKCANSIEINPRGCYLVVGASGEGKSTFLKLLKGFYPDFMEGKLRGDLKSFSNSHYLFQNPFTQLLHENALSEFMFSMENKKFTKIEMDQSKSWLAKFGLKLNEKSKTSILSHGEAQRLLLASLVAAKPDWLFLDEPTAFLDFERRRELYQLFGKMKKNTGLLIIDHHVDEISSIVDGYFTVVKKDSISEVEYSEIKPILKASVKEEIQFDKLPTQKENIQIKLQDINFSYAEKNILSNLNCEFKTGTITSIVGVSGIGKSTLLKVLVGLLREKNGAILFNDKKIKDRINFFSFLFQNPETHFLLDTLKEEIDSFDFDPGLKLELLQAFNLNHRLDLNPFLLSEGEKRRLSLLMVMMMKRPFLLLDEPTFGQDLEQVEFIKKFILEYKKKNYGVILISHDPEFYGAISDQVIYLKDERKYE